MRVLMVNTPDSQRLRGGDLVQMRQTAAALAPLGVQVTESFDPEPDATGCDLAHVFNLRTLHATPHQVRHLKRQGVPVVLSPIYLNPSLALWGTQAVRHAFSQPGSPDLLERRLAALAARTPQVRGPRGEVWAAASPNRPRPDYDRLQAEVLSQVDHLLPNSVLEMNELVKALRVTHLPFTVVPYAADPHTFLDPDPEPFVRKHGLRDFVLQVGRVEPSKNQLLLACALRDLDLPLVLVGGQHQPAYLEWCRKYGPTHLLALPHLPPEELRSAYAAARVHALPSWVETCGLVSMEAALADCNLVLSTAGYELEYFRDLGYYCDPGDVGSIRWAVVAAVENHGCDAPRRQHLKELILRESTWERAAQATYRAYCQALGIDCDSPGSKPLLSAPACTWDRPRSRAGTRPTAPAAPG